MPNGKLSRPSRSQRKLRESRKRYRYLDVAGALGTLSKVLIKGLDVLDIRGQVETMKTAAILRSTGILKRNLETLGDLV